MRILRGAAVAALIALPVSACGGSSKQATTAPATTGTTTAPPRAHANVPAVFKVSAGGSLTPRTISVPAALPVQLTVVSRDGRSHTAVLKSHSLSVPAGGRASVLVSGLAPGTYALAIDGATRGSLVIGVQPGP